MDNYSQKTVVNEGTDAYGTNKQVIFHGHDLVVKRSYDAQPLLDRCKEQRILTADQRWGDMRKVAEIPMAEYEKFIRIRDTQERLKAVKLWIQQNSDFCTFDKYIKK